MTNERNSDLSIENVSLSVIVPVYNEAATIAEIVRRVRAVPIAKEIIVIDDGSTDATADILREYESDGDLHVIRHARNRGKGAAVRAALQFVTGDIVVIQDADLEYNPLNYLDLIRPLVEGTADVVYGARFLGPAGTSAAGRWHRAANRMLTMFSNACTGLCLNDMETCYKVFRREAIEAIAPTLREDRFGIDPELTAKIARRKLRVAQVPISYERRSYREGKKIGVIDAARVVYCVLRYWWAN